MYGNNVAGNLKLYVNWQWYNMYGNNVCFLTSLALDDTWNWKKNILKIGGHDYGIHLFKIGKVSSPDLIT